MEAIFDVTHIPNREVRSSLATELRCTKRQVQVWPNKRQRKKRATQQEADKSARRSASDADEDDQRRLTCASANACSRTTCEGVVPGPGAKMEVFLEGVAPHRGKRA